MKKNLFFNVAFFAFMIFNLSCSGFSKSGLQSLQNRKNNKSEIIDQRLASGYSHSDSSFIIGRVVKVIDGDTFDLLTTTNTTIRVRMEGIDAPEKGMPFYKKSKDYLADRCFNKKVKFIPTQAPDKLNRMIGYSYLESGEELSLEMIKAGLAWHYKKYNSDDRLANSEIEARNAKRGLWIHKNPMPPWVNKKLHRQGISTKGMFDLDTIH